jgi:hypothetical protein
VLEGCIATDAMGGQRGRLEQITCQAAKRCSAKERTLREVAIGEKHLETAAIRLDGGPFHRSPCGNGPEWLAMCRSGTSDLKWGRARSGLF